MDGFETISDILPFVIPLLILELGLLTVAIVDLLNRQKVRGDKLLWVLLIVVIGIIGPIIYFIFGRQKDTVKAEE